MKIVGKHLNTCYSFVILLISIHLLADSILCASKETDVEIREKRNIFCRFGLTYLIKEGVLLALHEIKNLDPLPVEDLPVITLKNGILRGLSTLTNTKDVEVKCIGNDLIALNTTLSVKNVELLCNWTEKFIFEVDGSILMKADEVEFELGILMNTTSNVTLQVTKTLLTKLHNFNVGFTGLGPIDPLVREVIDSLYSVWKSEVTTIAEHIIKKIIDLQLPSIAHLLGNIMR